MEAIQIHFHAWRSEEFVENSGFAVHSVWTVSTGEIPWPN